MAPLANYFKYFNVLTICWVGVGGKAQDIGWGQVCLSTGKRRLWINVSLPFNYVRGGGGGGFTDLSGGCGL